MIFISFSFVNTIFRHFLSVLNTRRHEILLLGKKEALQIHTNCTIFQRHFYNNEIDMALLHSGMFGKREIGHDPSIILLIL
jgi:hypothetical protein